LWNLCRDGFLKAQLKAWADPLCSDPRFQDLLQVHSIGRWDIVYVNPADDPRQARK